MNILRRAPSGRAFVGQNNGDIPIWNSASQSWNAEPPSFVQPGAPVYDVMGPPFNAVGHLAADDTNAISNAILAANARPGVIYLGPAHRTTANVPQIQNHNISIIGRGPFNGGTIWQLDGGGLIDGPRASNCQYTTIKDIWITGARAYTTGWGVRLSGCYRAAVQNVVVSSMGRGVEVDRCVLTYLEQANCADNYGPFNHYAHGAGGTFNHAVKYRDSGGGTNFPLALVGNARSWAQNTAYVAGNVVLANGNFYQCLQAGTSAGSGTGPSGLPTTNIATLRTTPIADGSGSLLWVFAMPAHAMFRMGSWAHTFELLDCGALQGAEGLVVEDDAPASGSAPLFVRTQNLQIDHAVLRGIALRAGGAHRLHMTFVTSIFGGTGIEIGSGVTGNVEFEGGEVFGTAQGGITLAGGGFSLVHGMQVATIGTDASGTRDCIEVAAGVTDFTISSCGLASTRDAPVTSRYGVSIGAGCDNYTVVGNRANRNLTGGFLNTPGLAASRVFAGNIGSIT